MTNTATTEAACERTGCLNAEHHDLSAGDCRTPAAPLLSMYAKLRHPLGGYFTCRPFKITSEGDGRQVRLHFASGEVAVVDAADLLEIEVAQ